MLRPRPARALRCANGEGGALSQPPARGPIPGAAPGDSGAGIRGQGTEAGGGVVGNRRGRARIRGPGLGSSRSCIPVSARGARVCGGWGTWELGGLHSVIPCCHSYSPSLAPAHPQPLLQNYLLRGSDRRFPTRPLFSPRLPAPGPLESPRVPPSLPIPFFPPSPRLSFFPHLPPPSSVSSHLLSPLPFPLLCLSSSRSVSPSSPSLSPLPPSESGRGGKDPRGWG